MLMPDKTHTTNYTDTFIEIAADSNQMKGEEPPLKEQKSVARLQYELLANHPYQYTSDDVLFEVFAQRHHVPKSQREAARQRFFSKGQACFRASPLPKKYGWGVHSNSQGKIALIGRDTSEYEKFLSDNGVTKVRAMRSTRKK